MASSQLQRSDSEILIRGMARRKEKCCCNGSGLPPRNIRLTFGGESSFKIHGRRMSSHRLCHQRRTQQNHEHTHTHTHLQIHEENRSRLANISQDQNRMLPTFCIIGRISGFFAPVFPSAHPVVRVYSCLKISLGRGPRPDHKLIQRWVVR